MGGLENLIWFICQRRLLQWHPFVSLIKRICIYLPLFTFKERNSGLFCPIFLKFTFNNFTSPVGLAILKFYLPGPNFTSLGHRACTIFRRLVFTYMYQHMTSRNLDFGKREPQLTGQSSITVFFSTTGFSMKSCWVELLFYITFDDISDINVTALYFYRRYPKSCRSAHRFENVFREHRYMCYKGYFYHIIFVQLLLNTGYDCTYNQTAYCE